MGTESAQHIKDLDQTWPLADDEVSQGDDHLRLIKKAIKQTFPGAGGEGYDQPILATELDLNFLTGTNSNIQEQINAKPNHSEVVLKSGDIMTGGLTIAGRATVTQTADDDYSGYTIEDGGGNITTSLYTVEGVEGVWLSQQGGGPLGFPDTAIRLIDGNVKMESSSGKSLDPSDPDHLTTKSYVDNALAEQRANSVGGRIIVVEVEGQSYTGMTLEKINGDPLGAFYVTSNIPGLWISHQGAGVAGSPETMLRLYDGKAELTSYTGKSGYPVKADQLATKQYVDTQLGKAPEPGDPDVPDGVVTPTAGRIVIEASPEDNYSGVVITDERAGYDSNAAAFSYERSTNNLLLIQYDDRFDDPALQEAETIVQISQGNIKVYSPTNTSTFPAQSEHLTNKIYVDTVVDSASALLKAEITELRGSLASLRTEMTAIKAQLGL